MSSIVDLPGTNPHAIIGSRRHFKENIRVVLGVETRADPLERYKLLVTNPFMIFNRNLDRSVNIVYKGPLNKMTN